MTQQEPSRLLIVGPTPPPLNGVCVMMDNLLHCGLPFEIRHLDTSDRRGVKHLGRVDVRNIALAFWHGLRFTTEVIRPGVAATYIPISQNWPGYLRDTLFLTAARCARRRIVVHLHGGMLGRFYAEASWPMRFVIRRTLSWVDAAIVLGESLRPCFDRLVPQSKVHVVPNGIRDTNPGRSSSNPEGPVTILHMSNLRESKGTLDVLRAAALVLSEGADAKFVLAGPWATGRDEKQGLEILEGESLRERVEFPGPVSGAVKDRLLAEADLFVMPTFYPYEGQPLVILEALSYGLPVIATDWGAIGETVEDGVCGQLVPGQNPRALADAILQLISDRGKRLAMGAAARTRFERMYTLQHFCSNLSSVFSRVLDER